MKSEAFPGATNLVFGVDLDKNHCYYKSEKAHNLIMSDGSVFCDTKSNKAFVRTTSGRFHG